MVGPKDHKNNMRVQSATALNRWLVPKTMLPLPLLTFIGSFLNQVGLNFCGQFFCFLRAGRVANDDFSLLAAPHVFCDNLHNAVRVCLRAASDDCSLLAAPRVLCDNIANTSRVGGHYYLISPSAYDTEPTKVIPPPNCSFHD